MADILDDINVIQQKDPAGALQVIASQYEQATADVRVWNGEHDDREITSIVVTGMGGSALAALIAKVVLQPELTIPFDIIRGYELPHYVNRHTLVVASSYSGNTEETLATLEQAEKCGAQLAILASGGTLIDHAGSFDIAHVTLPGGMQPRMATISSLRGLFALLANFGVISAQWGEDLEHLSNWLKQETDTWLPEIPTAENYAKQIALETEGKIPVFYGTPLTAPLAYKYKISWNETAKNVAFWNEYPEFNHNEFMGWTSHPIEKPFAVFDITSSFDAPRILQRVELSDKLLSGKRPQAKGLQLRGETVMAQLLWGAILADFASTYAAILNGVDPTPVVLIERLKKELADNPR